MPETPETTTEAPAELVALITPIIRRPCPRCDRQTPREDGDDVDCVPCLDSGSIGPIFTPDEATEYATRVLAAVLPAHEAMVREAIANEMSAFVRAMRIDYTAEIARGEQP